MVIVPQNISQDKPEVGDSRNTSVWIQSLPLDYSIHDIETRSSEPSSRCFLTKLGQKKTPLRISPFFTNRDGSFKGKNRETFDDTSHSKLANLATLVQPNTGLVCRGTKSFRENLAAEGILERDSKLITNARRLGTTSNYESSRQKWVVRCGAVNRKLIRMQ